MDFFDWDSRGDGRTSVITSPYIWVYVSVAAILTLITVGSFLLCTLRQKKDVDLDEKLP